jgi:hypothetical protein
MSADWEVIFKDILDRYQQKFFDAAKDKNKSRSVVKKIRKAIEKAHQEQGKEGKISLPDSSDLKKVKLFE